MSVGFNGREKSVRDELASRKSDYRTFKELRLKEAGSDLVTENNTLGFIRCTGDYYAFTETAYNFTTFDSISFGSDYNSPEPDDFIVEKTKFYFCVFEGCSFSNIKFVNCIFIGCTFSHCFTLNNGIIFEACNFSKNEPGRNAVDDMFSYFRFCELTVTFIKCDMSLNLFAMTNFYFSHFVENKMQDNIMADCGFEHSTVKDCDLRNTKIVNAKFIRFSFDDAGKGTKVNRGTYFGKLRFNKKDARELKYAVDMYFALKELFQDNKVSDLGGEYFYLYKRTEMLTQKGLSKGLSIISNIVCGYGERPFNSLVVSVVLVFICGNLYYLFGLHTHSGVIAFSDASNFGKMIEDLFQCYHFSLVTFSTVGYGNVYPIGASIVVNEIEMICAILLVGIWVSTLVRKMVR